SWARIALFPGTWVDLGAPGPRATANAAENRRRPPDADGSAWGGCTEGVQDAAGGRTPTSHRRRVYGSAGRSRGRTPTGPGRAAGVRDATACTGGTRRDRPHAHGVHAPAARPEGASAYEPEVARSSRAGGTPPTTCGYAMIEV